MDIKEIGGKKIDYEGKEMATDLKCEYETHLQGGEDP